jgi:hypothetical protein
MFDAGKTVVAHAAAPTFDGRQSFCAGHGFQTLSVAAIIPADSAPGQGATFEVIPPSHHQARRG